MRIRKKPWVKEEMMSYTNYIVPNPEKGKEQWNGIYQNTHAIHAEFGTGRGRFITTLAERNPRINYIAVEQKQEVLVQAIRKAHEKGLSNIKFILGNVNQMLDFFGENELSRIYLNFIDPWPKKRHAKRLSLIHI